MVDGLQFFQPWTDNCKP